MNVLHLSDTTLSGSPIRITKLLNKHTQVRARHLVWQPVILDRVFETDLVGSRMCREELRHWIYEWADVLHFHNRWRRQEVFKFLNVAPPNKPSVIQMHSPRHDKGPLGEDFTDEVMSGIPLAVIAQYHVREWPEAEFIVPNVVDVTEPEYLPVEHNTAGVATVSYAPSNWNAKGWNDKGYSHTSRILKRMAFNKTINYDLIVSLPHKECLYRKRWGNIGVDEVVTGSYHLSSLEYLAMGIPCFAYLDAGTEGVVKNLTGSNHLPWINTPRGLLKPSMESILSARSWGDLGEKSATWMRTYWSPEHLSNSYISMYNTL